MTKSSAMNTFLENLEKAVAFAGLQWKDVAISAGLAPQNLCAVRKGRHGLGVSRAESIANGIGIGLHLLFDPSFDPKKHMKKPQKNAAA